MFSYLLQMEWIVGTSIDTEVPAEGVRALVRTLIRRSLPTQILSRIQTPTRKKTENMFRDDQQLLLKYHANREHTEGWLG